MPSPSHCIWRRETPLGAFWAAVSKGLVVASGFGEPPPGARAEPHDPVCEALHAALERWLRGVPGTAPDVKFAALGTPFHREVLDAVRAVPFGATVTYGALAGLAGRPGAAQAVGQALARNPCLLLVPCHRVVPASGGLGGYAGGAALKAALLAHEARLSPAGI
jgi:methylated-DNA-[protein]-cysteine S-methyltransferase